jgi:hypothetical protein
MSNRIGCMACSGDLCVKCKFWIPKVEHKGFLGQTRWGVCQFFNDNPGAPRRIYAGNIRGIEDGGTVETTSKAKCRNFERG